MIGTTWEDYHKELGNNSHGGLATSHQIRVIPLSGGRILPISTCHNRTRRNKVITNPSLRADRQAGPVRNDHRLPAVVGGERARVPQAIQTPHPSARPRAERPGEVQRVVAK